MAVDRLDRWTERALALIDSEEGRRLYRRNRYEYGLGRKHNLCGLIQKACHVIKHEHIMAICGRVEEALAARKAERMAE